MMNVVGNVFQRIYFELTHQFKKVQQINNHSQPLGCIAGCFMFHDLCAAETGVVAVKD